MDSSRVSTFLISMLLIVYGSFRSLNMEEEQRLKKKEENLDENDKSKFFLVFMVKSLSRWSTSKLIGLTFFFSPKQTCKHSTRCRRFYCRWARRFRY